MMFRSLLGLLLISCALSYPIDEAESPIPVRRVEVAQEIITPVKVEKEPVVTPVSDDSVVRSESAAQPAPSEEVAQPQTEEKPSAEKQETPSETAEQSSTTDELKSSAAPEQTPAVKSEVLTESTDDQIIEETQSETDDQEIEVATEAQSEPTKEEDAVPETKSEAAQDETTESQTASLDETVAITEEVAQVESEAEVTTTLPRAESRMGEDVTEQEVEAVTTEALVDESESTTLIADERNEETTMSSVEEAAITTVAPEKDARQEVIEEVTEIDTEVTEATTIVSEIEPRQGFIDDTTAQPGDESSSLGGDPENSERQSDGELTETSNEPEEVTTEITVVVEKSRVSSSSSIDNAAPIQMVEVQAEAASKDDIEAAPITIVEVPLRDGDEVPQEYETTDATTVEADELNEESSNVQEADELDEDSPNVASKGQEADELDEESPNVASKVQETSMDKEIYWKQMNQQQETVAIRDDVTSDGSNTDTGAAITTVEVAVKEPAVVEEKYPVPSVIVEEIVAPASETDVSTKDVQSSSPTKIVVEESVKPVIIASIVEITEEDTVSKLGESIVPIAEEEVIEEEPQTTREKDQPIVDSVISPEEEASIPAIEVQPVVAPEPVNVADKMDEVAQKYGLKKIVEETEVSEQGFADDPIYSKDQGIPAGGFQETNDLHRRFTFGSKLAQFL